MHIITLTTDFGTQDYYVPVLKGLMLKQHRDLLFVDVSHNIKSHDIVQAAFVLKNTWSSFPEGTIHAVSVNNFGSEQCRFLVIEHCRHFFVMPDNGIFSLMFDTPPQYVYQIPFAGLNFQDVCDCFVRSVTHLVSGAPIAEIGTLATEIIQRITFQPVIAPSQIRGSVIYIDNYDNVTLNITRELFERVGKGRPFKLYFRRHDPITKLSTHYNDVPIGETLCLFNADYLEIAISMGKAAEMLGLKLEDTAQIDFLDETPIDLLE